MTPPAAGTQYAAQDYNYFRDYDAVTGRYIQSNPIGLAGGPNAYACAHGNPGRYVDPYGLNALTVVLEGFGADVAVPEPTDAAWPKWAGWGVVIAGAAIYTVANSEGAAWIDNPQAKAEWEDYKTRYSAPPPPDMDPCQRLRWKLEREKRLLQDRQAWDAKWLPGRHADANVQTMRAIRRLERMIQECGC